MILYHRTYEAKAILAQGFRDGKGTYVTDDREFQGVWLADHPLDVNEGADGDGVLVLDIPEEVIAQYEWIEEGKRYREFLVPAEIVNRYGPPRIYEEEE